MFYLNLNPWQFFLRAYTYSLYYDIGSLKDCLAQGFCESTYLIAYAQPPNVHRVTMIACVKTGLPLKVIFTQNIMYAVHDTPSFCYSFKHLNGR